MSIPRFGSIALLALASLATIHAESARAQETLVRFTAHAYVGFWDAGTLETASWSASSMRSERGLLEYPAELVMTDGVHVGGGIFYTVQGIPNDGQPEQIARIDARTRLRTVVGSTGFDSGRRGLAYDSTTGTLYLLANSVSTLHVAVLHTVDMQTGTATAIAATPPTIHLYPNSLTIDAQGRALLLTCVFTSEVGPFPPKVQQLDLATAVITDLGTFASVHPPTFFEVVDAAVRADGQLFMEEYHGTMYLLDPATLTGQVVNITNWGLDWMAIAPDPQVGLAYQEGCSAPLGCPCSPTLEGARGNGCANSNSYQGANLRAYGRASLANDSLHLVAADMPDSAGLFVQGTVSVAPTAFGDGLRCVGGTLRRIGGGIISGSGLEYPSGGQVPIATQGQVLAPGTRVYQGYYRNNAAYCTPATFNLTNSVTVQWVP